MSDVLYAGWNRTDMAEVVQRLKQIEQRFPRWGWSIGACAWSRDFSLWPTRPDGKRYDEAEISCDLRDGTIAEAIDEALSDLKPSVETHKTSGRPGKTDFEALAQAVAEVERQLPGWWWCVHQGRGHGFAAMGVDHRAGDAWLIEANPARYGRDFHINLPANGIGLQSPGHALMAVLRNAVAARQETVAMKEVAEGRPASGAADADDESPEP